MQAFVEAVFIAEAAGAPMRRLDAAEAVVGRGLVGDRYLSRAGYWSGSDECQVTLIESEALDDILATTSLRVRDGEHRRNIVTRGIRLRDLSGRSFTVGEAILEYDRPRPPCGYLQSLTQVGMTRALLGDRGGICACVVKAGTIRPGDPIDLRAD